MADLIVPQRHQVDGGLPDQIVAREKAALAIMTAYQRLQDIAPTALEYPDREFYKLAIQQDHRRRLQLIYIYNEITDEITQLRGHIPVTPLNPDPRPEPLPWRELNGEGPTAKSGTWIREYPASNSATLIAFQPVADGFVMHKGSSSADLVATTEFCGWDPEFEDAINGFRHFTTRAALDLELRKLGIMPPDEAPEKS